MDNRSHSREELPTLHTRPDPAPGPTHAPHPVRPRPGSDPRSTPGPTPLADFPILIDSSGIFVRPEQHHFLCAVVPDEKSDHDDLPLDPDFTLFEDAIWPTLAERIPALNSFQPNALQR